jgi:serpin B
MSQRRVQWGVPRICIGMLLLSGCSGGLAGNSSGTDAGGAHPDAGSTVDAAVDEEASTADSGEDSAAPAAPDATDAGPPSPPPAVCSAPQSSASAAESLASDDTAFAIALYGPAAAVVGAGQNVIVSPYSVSAVMTMVDVGAAGETDTQMQAVLHLPGNAATVAPAYAALACEDETDGSSEGNQLSLANSVWCQEGTMFEPAFLSVLSTGYDAPMQQVDFIGDTGGATTAINQWVSQETQAEIPTLLQPGDLDTTTRIVLVNAVYFKGAWESGFDPSKTSPLPFTLSDGTVVPVPTMDGDVALATGTPSQSGFATYELAYKGGSLAMDFLVPQGPLSSLESSLTPALLDSALASLGAPYAFELRLPKFSFNDRLKLNAVLAGLGMTDLFERNVADLSGIDGAMDLYVSFVIQQAMVEVDEQGTVAAAATAAGGARGSVTVETPQLLAINQPFLFLIRDVKNGSLLFMGRVEDPRQGM